MLEGILIKVAPTFLFLDCGFVFIGSNSSRHLQPLRCASERFDTCNSTDLGYPKTFLGLNIRNENGSLSVNQSGYIDRMLARFRTANGLSAKTTLDPSLLLLSLRLFPNRQT